MVLILIFSILLCVFALFVLRYSCKKIIKTNIDEAAQGKILEEKNKAIEQAKAQLKDLEDTREKINSEIVKLSHYTQEQIASQKEVSSKAFENYCDVLDIKYKEIDIEYQLLEENLVNSYSSKQSELLAKLAQEEDRLDKIRSTRAAAIEAQRKEKEIKEKLSFYCLQISEADKEDIRILENIKSRLNKPRVLSMLIWSTFYQKQMTSLCNNILGTTTVCGIYKITNQSNDMCYIGQSVDTSTRWKNHAKAGLGIDTPAGNKLYKAMQEEGIDNFSWEIIEVCSPQDLNTKEKYYIELYQSYNYGYNSNKGNN